MEYPVSVLRQSDIYKKFGKYRHVYVLNMFKQAGDRVVLDSEQFAHELQFCEFDMDWHANYDGLDIVELNGLTNLMAKEIRRYLNGHDLLSSYSEIIVMDVRGSLIELTIEG